MLTITLVIDEFFDERVQEFVTNTKTLSLEHSLVSLSKWESIFEKPFLSSKEKTAEETFKYIECMILDSEIPPEVISLLSEEHMQQIVKYIDSEMSATRINEIPGSPKSSEVITSELIYYWLVTFNIPFETQHWHLNRLFNVIKICNIKSNKPKKMSQSEIAARNRELNAKRRMQLGTRG